MAATSIDPPMIFPRVTGSRFFSKNDPQVKLDRSTAFAIPKVGSKVFIKRA
jgi:hypothetical protein